MPTRSAPGWPSGLAFSRNWAGTRRRRKTENRSAYAVVEATENNLAVLVEPPDRRGRAARRLVAAGLLPGDAQGPLRDGAG